MISKSALLASTALLALILSMMAPAAMAQDDINETQDQGSDAFSLWDIGAWFISSSRAFMDSISEKGEQWFGIDQSIMVLFFLIVFLLAIRYKANGWMFWVLILMFLFFVASGMMPIGDYI